MDILAQVFPGIASLFVEDPILGVVRVGLTILGFVLAYFGFKASSSRCSWSPWASA